MAASSSTAHLKTNFPSSTASALKLSKPCEIKASSARVLLECILVSLVNGSWYKTEDERNLLISIIKAQESVFNLESKNPDESTSLVDYPFIDNRSDGHSSYPLTLLMHAAFHGCIPMAEACIQAGGSVAIELPIQRQEKSPITKTTALLESCHKGNEKMALFLLRHGAKAKVKDLLPIVARKKMPKLLASILDAALPEDRKAIPGLLAQLASEHCLHNVIFILNNMRINKEDPNPTVNIGGRTTTFFYYLLQLSPTLQEQINEGFYICHWLLTNNVRIPPDIFKGFTSYIHRCGITWEPKLIAECIDKSNFQYGNDRGHMASSYLNYTSDVDYSEDVLFERELRDRTRDHMREEKRILSTCHAFFGEKEDSRVPLPDGVQSIICDYGVPIPQMAEITPKPEQYTVTHARSIPFARRT